MPITACHHCRADHAWSWEEAFDKFGFEDGDGPVHTHLVAQILEATGLEVSCTVWGMHNTVIHSIQRSGEELIPADIRHGYDDPRDYLPADIVALLDQQLPADAHLTDTAEVP